MAEPTQLAELGRALDAALAARGVPFRVSDGPEPTGATSYRDRIVIEDRQGGDTFTRAGTRHGNPPSPFTRTVAARVKIYAQSTIQGATYAHHKGRAEAALEHVMCAMDTIVRGGKGQWRPTGGGFDVPSDLAGSQVRSGALYVLEFDLDRAIVDAVSWTVDAASEFTLAAGSIASTTNVFATGNEDAPAETGCGGG